MSCSRQKVSLSVLHVYRDLSVNFISTATKHLLKALTLQSVQRKTHNPHFHFIEISLLLITNWVQLSENWNVCGFLRFSTTAFFIFFTIVFDGNIQKNEVLWGIPFLSPIFCSGSTKWKKIKNWIWRKTSVCIRLENFFSNTPILWLTFNPVITNTFFFEKNVIWYILFWGQWS